MNIQLGIFLTYVGIIILIFIIGKVFSYPLKLALKLAINSLIGGVLIILFNLMSTHFGFIVPLNLVTAVTIGLLGVPGAILLLVICFL